LQWRGNYFWTGGQNRERQSREREIKVFAGIERFLSRKEAFPKKKKGLRRIKRALGASSKDLPWM